MRLEEFNALPEDEQQELREEASDRGKKVFSRDYDTGGPAGGGEDWVMRHRGLFFVFTLDDLPPGPFGSLREAIVEGYMNDVTSATGEILCAGMPVEKLLSLLRIDEEVRRLFINGEEWAFDEKNGWHRSPD